MGGGAESASRRPLRRHFIGILHHSDSREGHASAGFAQMATIYDPPPNVRHKFAARRSRQAETPLAFCSVLLVLAKAAFPKMDYAGVDSLVIERLLTLAKDLNIILPATEEDELLSFKAARCIQAHLLLK
ncbi:unnamed protein product [Lampetra fluviatilis]